MSSPAIRNATPADLPALYELARRALPAESFSFDLFAEKLTHRPWPGASDMRTFIAEEAGRPVGFMQMVVRPALRRGWLGLFAVAADARRRGVGVQLWQTVRAALPADLENVEVLALPANTFLPGLDSQYEVAARFVEQLGFERFAECHNLRVDLGRAFDGAEAERQLAEQGIDIRRARAADAGRLDAFFAVHFGADWRCEAGLALHRDPPALHLALRGDRIIGFSAHSTQNREWGFFGPMGTAPEARGAGVGRVLLWRCLNDLRDAGHASAIIPWVGPVPFYERWSGARIERTFHRYRLTMAQE